MRPETAIAWILQLGLALPITGVTAALWIWILTRIIPYYRDKRFSNELAVFYAAGLASIPLTLLIHRLLAPALWSPVATLSADLWNMILVVGVIEEFSKWLIFAVLMQKMRPLRSPEDGIMLAAAVGLAFATVENVTYVSRYGLWVLRFRSVFSTLGHMTYGALWGFVWSSLTWDTGGAISRRELPAAMGAIGVVAVIHGLYNTAVSLGVILGIGIKFITLLICIYAFQYLLEHSPYRHQPLRRARRASQELRTALRHNPRSVVLRRRLGLHLLRLRDYAGAEQQFRRARLQMGRESVALDFLTELAVYAQARTDEGTRRLRVMYHTMPSGLRHWFRSQLPELVKDDPALSAIVRGLVGRSPRWLGDNLPAPQQTASLRV